MAQLPQTETVRQRKPNPWGQFFGTLGGGLLGALTGPAAPFLAPMFGAMGGGMLGELTGKDREYQIRRQNAMRLLGNRQSPYQLQQPQQAGQRGGY